MVRLVGKRKTPASPRFGVYLDDTELKWMRTVRGRFLIQYGEDLSTTAILRAGLGLLRAMDEAKLMKLLEQHRGRRPAKTRKAV